MSKLPRDFINIFSIIVTVALNVSCEDNPSGPEPGLYEFARYTSPNTINAIRGDSNYAYIAIAGYGIQVVEMTSADSVELTSEAQIFQYAYGLDIQGDFIYLADGSQGLKIVDISTIDQPGLAGELDLNCTLWQVSVAGDLAYIASGIGVVQIVDVAIPTAPALVSGININGESSDIATEGNLLYVLDRIDSFSIYNVTDPENPQPQGIYYWQSTPTGFTAGSDCCFIAESDRIEVISIANPDSLYLLFNIPQSSAIIAIAYHSQYLYYSCDNDDGAKLSVLYIANDNSYDLVAEYELADSCRDIFVYNESVYLACGNEIVLLNHVCDSIN